MKFSCEKYLIQAACAVASRATASKSTIPALEGLLLEADLGLTVTGYDLRKGIYTRIEADVAEKGSVVVGARFLGEMLRRLPDGIVTVSTDDNLNVTVKCGRSEFNFIGISPADFPEMPVVDGVNNITVPQSILRSMINQTIFAVATSDARPIYTGTLFEISSDVLTLVSVDGYRLAKRSEKIEKGHMEDCSFVVPGSALGDIERICSDEDGEVSIAVGTKHILFTIGETVVVSRRLEGEFLNYKKSIPDAFRFTVKVVGKAEDVCSCEGSGDGLEIGFNDRYLMDALKAAGSDRLDLCLNSASSPCIVRAADGSDKFTYMILPVRLRAGD